MSATRREFITSKCGDNNFSRCFDRQLCCKSQTKQKFSSGFTQKERKMCRYRVLLIFLYSSLMEHQSIELYDRLHQLIDYVKNHTESQKPDLMLGIYLCEGDENGIKNLDRTQCGWYLWRTNILKAFKFSICFHSATEDNAFQRYRCP